MSISRLRQENGFTLIELLVASVVTMLVVGGAVALTSQIQNGYRRQLEDSAGEQEARYALEWIARYLRGAGNNPRLATTSTCPSDPTPFEALRIDPNDDGVFDDITLQMDANPPDGKIGGDAPDCNQTFEHITISFCSAAEAADGDCASANTIEFVDVGVGGDAATRTDNVIDNLQFQYLQSDGTTEITDPDDSDLVFYVRVQITIRTRTVSSSGLPETRTLQSTVRVRER